jgi:hypothetical protein
MPYLDISFVLLNDTMTMFKVLKARFSTQAIQNNAYFLLFVWSGSFFCPQNKMNGYQPTRVLENGHLGFGGL